MKIEYNVHNLDCVGCSTKIENEINELPEVDSAQLDFMNKRLTVKYAEKVEIPLERLNSIAGNIEPGVLLSPIGSEHVIEDKKPWFIVISVLLLAVSMFMPDIVTVALQLLAYIVASHKIIRTAVRELFSRQLFAEHFLMTFATFGALYLGEYIEAAAVMILFEAGQYLEGKAIDRSRGMVKAMLSLKPEMAHLIAPEGITDTILKDVEKNARILVYPGERIPLDGSVIKGNSTVDTSSLTGEAIPVVVAPDSVVYAGFINSSSVLEIEVSGIESESMISRILSLIENAGAKKSTTEKFITRFARYYTPAVVGAAVLVYLIPLLLGYSGAVWFKRALVFLIVSCPCALVISIPLSYFIGIGLAAKRGIIFKGSTYLDVLRNVSTLVFDKTGTLTTGDLKVSSLQPAKGISNEELTDTLYKCEYTSSHPFAKAIMASFTGRFDPAEMQAFSEYPGKGVWLQYQGDVLMAGSEAFLRSNGFITFMDAGNKSAVHAVKNNIYLGCVCFEDEIKPQMKENLSLLKRYGVKHICMLSGDHHLKAESVASELSLDSYYAGLVPEQKLEKLEAIIANSSGKVAYCGDGLNDAPVLARADVGIAMGKIGAEASIESADVVLLNDKPEQLVSAFVFSKKTNRLVWQNICIALGVKVLVMSSGLAGVSGLWEAIIADVGVTLLVIFHSLRTMSKQDKLDK